MTALDRIMIAITVLGLAGASGFLIHLALP